MRMRIPGLAAAVAALPFSAQAAMLGDQVERSQALATLSSSTTATPIPLPPSLLMLLGALAGLAFIWWRRSA